MAHSAWTDTDAPLSGAHRALATLRGLETSDLVAATGLRALVQHCGFERAILYAVAPDRLCVHAAAGDGGLPVVGDQLRLSTVPQAADALRRSIAVRVADGSADLAQAKGSGAVIAPLVPAGSALALLAADHPVSGRAVDHHDGVVLRVFAEAFGFALSAATMRERLEAQRRHFRRITMTGDAILSELCDEPLALSSATDLDWAALPSLAQASRPVDGRDPLLSSRELEVLALITEGARNREIAARLSISEETVKSHVRRILRKLHAGNRAEAVDRYHRLRAV